MSPDTMRWSWLRPAPLLVAAALLASAAFAGNAAGEEKPREEPETSHRAARHAEHHRNHLGVFVGTTHDEGEDEFTVGADYEYRVPTLGMLGVGGLVDHAGGAIDSTVAAAALFVHPGRRLRLLIAPGIEHAHGENEFLVRAGVAYRFRLKRISVSPELNVDFVNGEEITVYGVSAGWGF